MVDSIPPSYTGGNIDNWRIGKGATMYYSVAVEGGLLSVGDSHASQADSELCGTAIECALNGTFRSSFTRRPAQRSKLLIINAKDSKRMAGARLQLCELPQ
jgi:acetamidase/formamidase